MTEVDPNLPVSHEVDGRVLTGVGTTAEALAETMERHSPASEGSEEADGPSSTTPAADVAPASQPDKRTRGQRRFDELTREREDAKRDADAARREAADLKARLDALSRPATQEPARAAVAQPQGPKKPSWAAFEEQIGAKYATWAEAQDAFTDAREDFLKSTLDVDARVRQSIEADRATRAANDAVATIHAKARELYPDFDAVRQSGPGSGVVFDPERLNQIISLPPEVSARVQYAIMRDGALAEQLARGSLLQFGMWLGSQVAPSSGTAPAVASPASTQRDSVVVPPPYQPVGTGSKTAATPASELPKRAGFDYDKSGYRERRNAELGRVRR